MFRIDQILHAWQNRFVLSIASLELENSERYALLGANGSGKSTLLRILADRLAGFRELEKPGSIAYLPQKPYTFDLTVRENIRLGIPAGTEMSRNQQNELIDRQIEELGLETLADAKGHRLSGGEAQRMALARVLVIPRQVLLLDEPTNALDLNGMMLAETALNKYMESSGCCLLLVSHQISLAERLCNQLIFLDQGRLEAAGPLAELLSNPLSESLNRFLYFEQTALQSGQQNHLIRDKRY